MDPLIAIELIRGVKAGLAWLMATRGGSPADAMAIVQQWQGARDKSIFGDDINDVLSMTASGVTFLQKRGVVVEEAVNVIAAAEAEGRDLTDEEVLAFFAATDEVAERVDDAIADLEAEEAADDGEPTGDSDPAQ
jgi:hypothetical protein